MKIVRMPRGYETVDPIGEIGWIDIVVLACLAAVIVAALGFVVL